jgi:hypothetical protein
MEVPFIHGGGHRHIQAFLEGKSKGYALENDYRKGIQVHAQNPGGINPQEDQLGRTNRYANRAASHYFDSPAMLQGSIKAKHLLNANNAYEHAIVDPAHIIAPTVTKLPLTGDELPGIADRTTINTLTPIRKKAAEKPGLWANIRAKKARGGKPAKPGDEAYPDKKQWNKLSKQ